MGVYPKLWLPVERTFAPMVGKHCLDNQLDTRFENRINCHRIREAPALDLMEYPLHRDDVEDGVIALDNVKNHHMHLRWRDWRL